MAKETRSFAVIGLRAFGTDVASELVRFGNRVMGGDLDERRVAQMATTLDSCVILDTTDDVALREAGIDQYDVALVAIGRDIQASILTTMNMKMLGVETIWVKAFNKTHHRILSKLGADRVILPEQEMGRHVAQMLNNPIVQVYVGLGNGLSVVNIVIPKRLHGRPLQTFGIGYVVLHDVFSSKRWRAWSLHTKIMLMGTAILIPWSVGMFALLEWTNPGTLGQFDSTAGKLTASHDGHFLDISFEVADAFGTFGLSRGYTTELNDFDRAVIVAIMFLGRVGPLTLGFFLATRVVPRVRYPEGRVFLG